MSLSGSVVEAVSILVMLVVGFVVEEKVWPDWGVLQASMPQSSSRMAAFTVRSLPYVFT